MKTTSTSLIFQYWDQLRGSRSAPERGEIEPGAVRKALLDTFILENTLAGLTFRLAGTRLCATFGGELKDRPFSSLWPDAATRVELSRMTDAVMDDSAGAITGISVCTDRGDTGDLELLVLPLRHRGKTHERVMGALSPVMLPGWLGHDRIVSTEIRSMRIIWPSGLRRSNSENRNSAEERRSQFTLLPGGRV
ncbi:MAG: PAS domain-containing protein [Bosea sp. (in: a-proteobacteria)]